MNKTDTALRNLASELISFPSSHVCKHWAAVRVLQTMQEVEIEVSSELADAVVNADDERALEILKGESK